MKTIYQATTDKSFAEAVSAVEAQTKANGFKVLYTHDIQANLAEKNFKRDPVKILEICNAKYAYDALNINVTVSLLMPCRINVYVAEGKTVISTVRPSALVELFDNDELRNFADEVEKVLIKIIDQSL